MFNTKIYTNKEEKIGGEKALNHLAQTNLASLNTTSNTLNLNFAYGD